jgi:hypothetical protein
MVDAVGSKTASAVAKSLLEALGLGVHSVKVLGNMNRNSEYGQSQYKVRSVVTLVVNSPSDGQTKAIAEERLFNEFGFLVIR